MASPRPFRHMPHTGRAPEGAPPAASVGVFPRVDPDYWAPSSRGPCSTRTSASPCTLAPQQPPVAHTATVPVLWVRGFLDTYVSWHASRAPRGASFEASWGLWGLFGGLLGPLLGLLGVSWGPLGLSWDPLGSLLCRLGAILGGLWGRRGASESRKGGNAKIIEKRKENE